MPTLSGHRLREQRKRAGITVEELALRTGYGFSTIYAWEQGRGAPRRPRLVALIAAVLHCRPDDLYDAEPVS